LAFSQQRQKAPSSSPGLGLIGRTFGISHSPLI
jgi:hypothetical protein